jgi:hypothetical protein
MENVSAVSAVMRQHSARKHNTGKDTNSGARKKNHDYLLVNR